MCADVTPRDALTAEDVRILGLETAQVAGHTLKVMVLDRGGELTMDELREWVGARVGRLPRLTQRLEAQPDGGTAVLGARSRLRSGRGTCGARRAPARSPPRSRRSWSGGSNGPPRCGASSWWTAERTAAPSC